MSGITVLSPVGINRVEAQANAPRLKSLDGIRLGILNNSKPNSDILQAKIVELLGDKYKFQSVTNKQKPNASVGAENLADYAKEVDAVITALGD